MPILRNLRETVLHSTAISFRVTRQPILYLSLAICVCLGCSKKTPSESTLSKDNSALNKDHSNAQTSAEDANIRLDTDLPVEDDPSLGELADQIRPLGGRVRRYTVAPQSAGNPSEATADSAATENPDEGKAYVELNFVDTNLTDEDLEKLAKEPAFQEVTSIHLGGTQITDAGLAQIAKARQLEMIDLSGTKVTDAGLKHLMGHKNLRYIMIEDSGISVQGADRLLRSLPALEDKW